MILDPRHTFMMALLKSREAKVVNHHHVDRLAAASTGTDARGVLRETDIGDYLESVPYRGAEQRDQRLWQYLADYIGRLATERFFPADAREFCRLYLLRYDVGNLKATLQRLALGKEVQQLPIGTIFARGLLEELEKAEDVDAIADILGRSGLKVFEPPVRLFNPAAGARGRLATDAALEGEYHRLLFHSVRSMSGGDILAKACGIMIDLANLSIVTRALFLGAGPSAGDHLIPYGYRVTVETFREMLAQGLQDVPRRLDDPFYRKIAAEVVSAYESSMPVSAISEIVEKHRLAAVRDLLSPQVQAAPVIAWFLIIKEIEVRNVRLLLRAMDDGLALEDVRRYLLL